MWLPEKWHGVWLLQQKPKKGKSGITEILMIIKEFDSHSPDSGETDEMIQHLSLGQPVVLAIQVLAG